MGKLGEEDFQALKREISSEALAAIREAEEEANRGRDRESGLRDDDLEEEIARARARLGRDVPCPECEHGNPAGSRFCADCGASLQEPGRPEPS
jgi:hypothetical protein